MSEINVRSLGAQNHVYFIGIGGISMSALAAILLHQGCRVSGSDVKPSNITKKLEEHGAKIFYGQTADNVPACDFVVYTGAIKADNPEMIRAKELGIPTYERPEFLGAVMKCYPKTVAVSGTHGKTTTTSMLTYCLLECNTDPTVTIGGEVDILGGNLRIGHSEYFLAEACEYRRSFLSFFPYIAVITNIEEDHLDYYKDINDIKDAFRGFADLVPSDGAIVACWDDFDIKDALKDVSRPIITYGLNDAEWTAQDISFQPDGNGVFTVYHNDTLYANISLSVPGKHNILNALAAIAVCDRLGLEKNALLRGLQAFHGTKRRFETKGYINDAVIVDDYAHHPTEIKATLTAAASTDHNDIWCIFQPHTYTRTKTLFPEFVEALTGDFHTIITDIYAAREKDTGLVSAKELADAIPGALYMKEFSEIEGFIRQTVKPGDLVLTMGAGNVVEIGEHLTE